MPRRSAKDNIHVLAHAVSLNVLRPGIGYIGTQNLRDVAGILGFMSLLRTTGRKT